MSYVDLSDAAYIISILTTFGWRSGDEGVLAGLGEAQDPVEVELGEALDDGIGDLSQLPS